MDYFLRYPDIKQKNASEFLGHYIFWDLAKNWRRSLQACHLKIDLPDSGVRVALFNLVKCNRLE